jgi:hypothetical protein
MINRNSRSDLFEERAVGALMEHFDPPRAASALGVSLRTLTRCMEKPAFQARLRAAERAHTFQQRIRLAEGFGIVVQSAASIVLKGKNPPARLQAARLLETIVRAADEIEDFGAEVAQLQRDSQAREAKQPATAGGPRRPAEHGARLSRRQQQAITELLPRRSVAEAAEAAGTSTGTLYRWLQEPAFVAALTEAVSALFGPAVRLARRAFGPSVTLILNLSRDPAVPEATRLKAGRYSAEEALRMQLEYQQARLAKLEPAGSGDEPAAAAGRIGRSLRQKLVRLQDNMLQAGRQSGIRLIFSHAVDGRQTGTSVIGADGRLVWHHPPEGCEKDAPVDNSEVSVPDRAA